MKNSELKITFKPTKATNCVVCEHEFFREELLSGRGRLIAGNLTNELRRQYEESKKYGKINPLIYRIYVCPRCFFASFSEDFFIPTKQLKKNIQHNSISRQNIINSLFGNLNFEANRTVKHGIASYVLATICYSFYDKKYSPSLKRAICFLRASWLLQDLVNETENEKFNFIKDSFYKKAGYFYRRAVDATGNGEELFENIRTYGPDIDKNFGYDGMLYISSLLTFKQIDSEKDIMKKIELLRIAKKTVSSLVGTGKSDYNKPGIIIDYGRDLFKLINSYIKELESSQGHII